MLYQCSCSKAHNTAENAATKLPFILVLFNTMFAIEKYIESENVSQLNLLLPSESILNIAK